MHFQVNGGLSGDPISCEPLFWEVLRDTLFRLTEEGGMVVMALLVSSDPQGRCCERLGPYRGSAAVGGRGRADPRTPPDIAFLNTSPIFACWNLRLEHRREE